MKIRLSHHLKLVLISTLVLICFFLNCINPNPVRTKDERIQGYLERGKLYIQAGDYQGYVHAEAQYRHVIALDPTNYEAYSQLGHIYYIFYENHLAKEREHLERREVKKAEEEREKARQNWNTSHNCFNEALKYKSDDGASHIGLTVLNFCIKRYDKAIEFSERALLLPKADMFLKGVAYFWLGRCYVLQEKFPEAHKMFKECLKVLPHGREAEAARKAIQEIERRIGPIKPK